MKKLAMHLVKASLGLFVLVAVLAAGALWMGNREVAPVSMVERQQSFQKAVSWVRANEADLFKEDNMALWWFIQTAAERTGDSYLIDLMTRYTAAVKKAHGPPFSPWLRMIEPKSEITLNMVNIRALEPYQRFFYHGVTCRPVELDDGDTSIFLKNEVCHPTFSQVWLKDPACTTHHLMGVMLLHRVGCLPSAELKALEVDLLADVQQQMRWDVIVKDAYLQRLMMLMWQGRANEVKPIWLKRALQSQQADGGWVGGRQMPEFPGWAQPWVIRSKLAAWWPSRFYQGQFSDFHASAQGLLIGALAITDQGP